MVLPKYSVLRMARGLTEVFRPVVVTEIDDDYHAFIVRYSGDYIAHEHEHDEFITILEGELHVEMDGENHSVRQGECVLIPAGVKHKPRCPNMALALVVERKGLQAQMDPRV